MKCYTVREIAEAKQCSDSFIRRRARLEGWSCQDNGKGGRLLFTLDALPKDVRQALCVPRPEEITEETMREYLKAKRISVDPERMKDPEIQAKVACARALEDAAWGDKKAVVATLAARYRVSEITIRRWADEVESWRIAIACNDKVELSSAEGVPLVKVEIPRTRKFDREAMAYGIMTYARNIRSGKRAAYDDLCAEAGRKGWAIGDYTNFTRAVGKIPRGVWDRIRRGTIGFDRDYIPKIVRSWLSLPVMTVLCGDQHIFDYKVFDMETGETMTPECYIWMDCTSRYWAGVWPEMGHYNSFTVGHSLREALRWGLPDEIFTDWGKPEGSKHIAQMLSGLSGYSVCGGAGDWKLKYWEIGEVESGKSEGGNGNADGRGSGIIGDRMVGSSTTLRGEISHRKAQAGVPWNKPIENQMNILERELANRFTPGYRKRDADAWINKERNRHLKQERLQGKLLSIEEFLEAFFDVIRSHNRSECRVKEQIEKIVPEKVFFNGLVEQSRPVFDDRTLDYLFLPRYQRKPRQSVVEVMVRKGDRRCYYSPLLSGRKEKVQVSVDPYDVEAPAIITDLDGAYIDLAEPWEVQDPGDGKGLREKLIRQAKLRKWWKEQTAQVVSGFGLLQAEAGGDEGGGKGSGGRVLRISGATTTARKAEKDRELRRELKPKPVEAGKKLERMYEELMGDGS